MPMSSLSFDFDIFWSIKETPLPEIKYLTTALIEYLTGTGLYDCSNINKRAMASIPPEPPGPWFSKKI